MGEVPSEASSSREVWFETQSVQEEESDEEEYDISEDGSEEEEEDIFHRQETRHATSKTSIAMKAKNSKNKGKSVLTSIINSMTEESQNKCIFLIDTLQRHKWPTRGGSKSQSASQTTET